MKNQISQFIGLTLLGALALNQTAAAQTTALDLSIELHGFPTTEKVKDKTYSFGKSCKIFAKYLMKNKGLWGTGPFQNITCNAITRPKKESENTKRPWILKIHGDNREKYFEISYRNDSGKYIPQVVYRLTTEVGPLALMSRAKTNALIAFYLSQSLPFRSALPAGQTEINQEIISGPIGALKDLTPPRELAVFSMSRADDLWQVKPLGRATFQEEKKKKYEWSVGDVDPSQALVAGEFYLVQQIDGRDETLRRADELIKSDVESFFDNFMNLGRSAYVGARYGFPIRGQGILKNAPLIGLFGEFRSGFLSGMKINYDLIPQQKYTDQSGESEFSWSRFQLGYSFTKSLSNKWITSIDATPRIGLTTLNFSFKPPATESESPYDFKMTRAPTIGFEAGAEKTTNYFRLRAWAYGSFSVGILPIDRNHSTTSTRIGLDAYREVLSFNTIKLAILGFTALESTTIEKKLSNEELSSTSFVMRQLKFSTTFAGGGLTLTW